jgi:hypothetical protein
MGYCMQSYMHEMVQGRACVTKNRCSDAIPVQMIAFDSTMHTWETPNADVQQPEEIHTPCAPACVLGSSSYDHHIG